MLLSASKRFRYNCHIYFLSTYFILLLRILETNFEPENFPLHKKTHKISILTNPPSPCFRSRSFPPFFLNLYSFLFVARDGNPDGVCLPVFLPSAFWLPTKNLRGKLLNEFIKSADAHATIRMIALNRKLATNQ